MEYLTFEVTENIYNSVKAVGNGTQEYVFFQLKEDNRIGLFFAHGGSDGKVTNQNLTSQEVLNLVYSDCQRKGIKQIFIVSCYGGLLPEVRQKDVFCRSITTDKVEISVNTYASLNQKTNLKRFFLEIVLNNLND